MYGTISCCRQRRSSGWTGGSPWRTRVYTWVSPVLLKEPRSSSQAAACTTNKIDLDQLAIQLISSGVGMRRITRPFAGSCKPLTSEHLQNDLHGSKVTDQSGNNDACRTYNANKRDLWWYHTYIRRRKVKSESQIGYIQCRRLWWPRETFWGWRIRSKFAPNLHQLWQTKILDSHSLETTCISVFVTEAGKVHT